MDVTAENNLLAGKLLEVVLKVEVALFRRDGLTFPAGERMSTRRGDTASVALGGFDYTTSKAAKLGTHLRQSMANRCADLDLGEIKLVRDLFAEILAAPLATDVPPSGGAHAYGD